jgi:hypothetical protein
MKIRDIELVLGQCIIILQSFDSLFPSTNAFNLSLPLKKKICALIDDCTTSDVRRKKGRKKKRMKILIVYSCTCKRSKMRVSYKENGRMTMDSRGKQLSLIMWSKKRSSVKVEYRSYLYKLSSYSCVLWFCASSDCLGKSKCKSSQVLTNQRTVNKQWRYYHIHSNTKYKQSS